MRFVITTSDRTPGARLSLRGEWGNRPFPTVEAAEAEVRAIAGKRFFILERERGRK